MKIIAIATGIALAAGLASIAPAQTRDDLRGPTGQQRVKLPPGVKGATGGQARPAGHHRTTTRHHRHRPMRRHAHG